MSRNNTRKTAPKGKIVRRLGANIFGNPKYDKLLARRPAPPGGATRRNKQSVYGLQLQEKQKIRFAYGVSERQLQRVYTEAKKMEGVTGTNMLALLESRFDNVVYRLGFCTTRPQARQMVRHGHFTLNGRKVDMPGVRVRAGDVITVREKSLDLKVLKENMEAAVITACPAWLSLAKNEGAALVGTVLRMPERSEIISLADEQLVVEYYAK